jgi:hypothetical protein
MRWMRHWLTPAPVGPQREQLDQGGFCVRIDWPGGDHDLVDFTTDFAAANRSLEKTHRYWSAPSSPVRPKDMRIVPVERSVWDAHRHRRNCRRRTCPSVTPRER